MLKKLAFILSINIGILYGMQPALPKDRDSYALQLLEAARNNKKSEVIKLLNRGVSVNTQIYNGYTALHMAAFKEYKEILKVLLAKGADPNLTYRDARGVTGNTALLGVVEQGNKELVKMLIKAGADVNACNAQGSTALTYAVINGHTEIVKLLLEHKADPYCMFIVGAYKNNTLLMVAAHCGHTELIKILLDYKSTINECNSNGTTALLFAAMNGHKEIVRLLLDNGADVSAQDENGTTGLMKAAEKGYTEIVTMFLVYGADKNVQDEDKKNVLIYAIYSGQKELVKMLIDAGVDWNVQSNDGSVPLHCAIGLGHKDIVKLFLDHGADPHTTYRNAQGEPVTALLLAISVGDKDIIELLLEAKVPLKVFPHCAATFSAGVIQLFKNGKLPAGLVNEIAKNNYTAMLAGLIKTGFKGDVKDKKGITPLMKAAFYGHTSIVKMLIDAGADVNIENDQTETALSKAAYKGHKEIVHLLLDAGAWYKEKAFLHAAQQGKVEIMNVLLKAGVFDIYEYSKLSYPQGLDPRQCHVCKKKEEGPLGHYKTLKICVGCKVVYYCSEECQLKDWARHQEFCQNKEAIDEQVHRCTVQATKKEDYSDSPFWNID